MTGCDVLIVGAGPTGLALALWLTKLGVIVRIFDKTEAPGTTSRALAIQARTLELYRQLDLRRRCRDSAQGARGQPLGARREKGPRFIRGDRPRSHALPVFAHLPPGRTRKFAPCTTDGDGRAGGAADRTHWLCRRRRSGRRAASPCRRLGRDDAKPPTSPAATARAPWCAKRWASDFPGGTYQRSSSTSPTSRPPDPLVDGELHVDLDDADFLAVFPSRAKAARA